MEYELLDTGVFNEDRYFDIFVEYAKAGPDDLGIKISVANRGPEEATLHLLPTLWFRNIWSWSDGGVKPILAARRIEGTTVISAHHSEPVSHESFPDYKLYCEGEPFLLFTENETNNARLFRGQNASAYVKDGINDFVVSGNAQAVNPAKLGTKASPHYILNIDPGKTRIVRMRLARPVPGAPENPFKDLDEIFTERLKEADEFYESITPPAVMADPDRALVMRQALAGMLWSKQYFYYDLNKWLKEHNIGPWSPPEAREKVRNSEWFHMDNDDIISMPDKWEYPWYAAWDLAFHMLAFQTVDADFAKSQLGMPGIEKRIARYPQFFSRIGFVHEFRPLSDADIQVLLERRWAPVGIHLPAPCPGPEVIAAVIRLTRGNFRLLVRLLTQMERVVAINGLDTLSVDVVETARENLVMGQA